RRDTGLVDDRPFEARPLALGEVQAEAYRVGNGEDVREEDRGVERKALQRLQRDFARELVIAAQVEEAARTSAGGAVLGQVATGLAHQPHGRVLGGLAPQRAQEGIVLQGGGHRTPVGCNARILGRGRPAAMAPVAQVAPAPCPVANPSGAVRPAQRRAESPRGSPDDGPGRAGAGPNALSAMVEIRMPLPAPRRPPYPMPVPWRRTPSALAGPSEGRTSSRSSAVRSGRSMPRPRTGSADGPAAAASGATNARTMASAWIDRILTSGRSGPLRTTDGVSSLDDPPSAARRRRRPRGRRRTPDERRPAHHALSGSRDTPVGEAEAGECSLARHPKVEVVCDQR